MDQSRVTFLASAVVLGTGIFWGIYWLPVREIARLGLDGAWGSVVLASIGMMVLAPFAWGARRQLAQGDPIGTAAVALGGFALVLYSSSILYGQVAIVVLLFFLTPVWSTVLGRILFGWPITRARLLVLMFGLIGLGVMLSGEGVLPVPRSLGEWLGLSSGVAWAVASTGMHVRRTPTLLQGGFVFATGGAVGGACLAVWLGPLPDLAAIQTPVKLGIWVVATGVLWWALVVVGLMWATPKLEPARTGILMMIEVLVAAISAALIIGEHLSATEVLGGALVLISGLIEVWPTSKRRRVPAATDI